MLKRVATWLWCRNALCGASGFTGSWTVHAAGMKVCATPVILLRIPLRRNEFITSDFPELVIKDANGAVVYRCWYATFEHAILWVWRDFLLSTVVNAEDDTISKQAVSDIESVGLASKMMNRLKEEISGECTCRCMRKPDIRC